MMTAQYGKITNFKYETLGSGKKLLAKVEVDNRVTNFLPVQCHASSFLVEHLPIAINDLVMVLNPFGNDEDGYITRNLPYKDIPLPANVDADTHIKVFKDGTNYVHNVKNKKISLKTPCDIDLETTQNINLTAKNDMQLTAKTVNYSADTIKHDGVSIDNKHSHTQNSGDHFGAGANVSAPNN